MDHTKNSLRQAAEKSLRELSVGWTTPSYMIVHIRKCISRSLAGTKLTKMASSKAMVSGLSYWVFLVNQWIIWNSSGLNSCSATYIISDSKGTTWNGTNK